MGQVEDAIQVGVDDFAPTDEFDQCGFLGAIALVTLQTGDAPADGLGSVGGSSLGDLGVEGREFLVLKANGDLSSHDVERTQSVNQLVCISVRRTSGGARRRLDQHR